MTHGELRPQFGIAGLEGHDLLIFPARFEHGPAEGGNVVQTLDIEGNGADVIVISEHVDIVGNLQHRLVAGGNDIGDRHRAVILGEI